LAASVIAECFEDKNDEGTNQDYNIGECILDLFHDLKFCIETKLDINL
jgi:hypothetical protein